MRDIIDIVYLSSGFVNYTNSSFDYLNDPEVQRVHRIFIGFCSAYIPLILFSSGLVFWGTVLYPGFHSTNNYLLLSLSVSDILMGAFCLPMHILSHLPNTKTFILSNQHACLAWFSSTVVAGAGSLHTLLLISLDRYIAVMFPLKYHMIVTRGRAKFTIILNWCYVVVLAFLPMFGWHVYRADVYPLVVRCNYYNTLPFAYVVWSSFATVSFTIGVSAILYVQIIAVAFRQVSHFRHQMPMLYPKQIKRFENRVRSVKITSFLILLYMFLWLPYLLVVPLKYYNILSPKNLEITKIALQIVNFADSLVNLPVYAIGRQEYLLVYKAMLTTMPWRWKPELRNIYRSINSSVFSKETLRTSDQLTGHYASEHASENALSDVLVDWKKESELFRFSFDKSTSVDSQWKLNSETTASEYITQMFDESDNLRKQSLYSAFVRGVKSEENMAVGQMVDDYLLIKLYMDRELARNAKDETSFRPIDDNNDYIIFYKHIAEAGSSVDTNIAFYDVLKQRLARSESDSRVHKSDKRLSWSPGSLNLNKGSSFSGLKKQSLFSELYEKHKQEIDQKKSRSNQNVLSDSTQKSTTSQNPQKENNPKRKNTKS